MHLFSSGRTHGLSIVILLGSGLQAQTWQGPQRLLERLQPPWGAAQTKSDFPCKVVPVKPLLGFDLRTHAGYFGKLGGDEAKTKPQLGTITFRITSQTQEEAGAVFSHDVHAPSAMRAGYSAGEFEGWFDVGTGTYRVDWQLVRSDGRTCSARWIVENQLAADPAIAPDLIPGAITEVPRTSSPRVTNRSDPFKSDPSKADPARPALTLLVDFAAESAGSAALPNDEFDALWGMLQAIASDHELRLASLIVFNIHLHRVVFQQNIDSRVDWNSLTAAVRTMKMGTVEVSQLGPHRVSDTDFLTKLLAAQTPADYARPLVVLGRRVPIIRKGRKSDTVDPRIGHPFFYLGYDPQTYMFQPKDPIGNLALDAGGSDTTVHRPADFQRAWSEIRAKILRDALER